MTRYRNLQRPAACYYLSGNTCSALFVDAPCYEFFRLRLLNRASAYGVFLHAFTVLPGEIFLIASADEHDSVRRLLESLVHSYRDYFNLRFRRYARRLTTPLKIAELRDFRTVLACQKFLDTEPVRQLGLAHPGRFHWSSYSYYAFGGASRNLSPHPALHLLDSANADRLSVYRNFIARGFDPAFVRFLAVRLRQGIAIKSSLRQSHAA